MSVRLPEVPFLPPSETRSVLEDYLFRLQGFLLSLSDVQGLTGPGAIDIGPAYTAWTTTGADAATLVDGDVGQTKTITLLASGGLGTLTPANFGSGTAIEFDAVGDSVTLWFNAGQWWVVANNGCVII